MFTALTCHVSKVSFSHFLPLSPSSLSFSPSSPPPHSLSFSLFLSLALSLSFTRARALTLACPRCLARARSRLPAQRHTSYAASERISGVGKTESSVTHQRERERTRGRGKGRGNTSYAVSGHISAEGKRESSVTHQRGRERTRGRGRGRVRGRRNVIRSLNAHIWMRDTAPQGTFVVCTRTRVMCSHIRSVTHPDLCPEEGLSALGHMSRAASGHISGCATLLRHMTY